MKKHVLLLILFFLSFTFSCKKDLVEPLAKQENSYTPHAGEGISFRDGDGSTITTSEARQWFTSQYGVKKSVIVDGDLFFEIAPVWAFSQQGEYGPNHVPVVVAPLQSIQPFEEQDRTSYFLLCYRNAANQMEARIVLCFGDDTYIGGTKPKHPEDFSGIILGIDMNGQLAGDGYLLCNGTWVGGLYITPQGPEVEAYDPADWEIVGNAGDSGPHGGFRNWLCCLFHMACCCPNPAGGGHIKHHHSGGGGGDNSNPVPDPNGPPANWGGPWIPNGNWNPSLPTGTGGGGGGTTNEPPGTALTLYHVNNPLIKIEDYLEENNLGEYPGVFECFGQLSNEAKMFLAYYQPYIDMAFDYLVSNGCSVEAQNNISQVVELMIDYPLNWETAIALVEAENELGEYDIENNPPSTTGWLNCESFAFVQVQNLPIYITGVDNLFFSWYLPQYGITKTVGPFSIDISVNGNTPPLDDIIFVSAWSANRAGKIISFLVAAEPYLSEGQIRSAFVAEMKRGYSRASSMSGANVDISLSSIFSNRASAIYTNFAWYLASCL